MGYGQTGVFHPIWRPEFWQLPWPLVEQETSARDVGWDRMTKRGRVVGVRLGRLLGNVGGLRVGGLSGDLVAGVVFDRAWCFCQRCGLG